MDKTLLTMFVGAPSSMVQTAKIAPLFLTAIFAEYLEGLGPSGGTVTDPNFLTNKTDPIQVRFESVEFT